MHSVSNFEALALAKRYGVDAQRMREVLLVSPGDNGTLLNGSDCSYLGQIVAPLERGGVGDPGE